MWDHLFEGDHDFGGEAEAARLALVEAVETQRVTAELLQSLAPSLAERLGREARLHPAARNVASPTGSASQMGPPELPTGPIWDALPAQRT